MKKQILFEVGSETIAISWFKVEIPAVVVLISSKKLIFESSVNPRHFDVGFDSKITSLITTGPRIGVSFQLR